MIETKEQIRRNKIFELLEKEYPNIKPQLEFSNPLELLIATILSAQCTDLRVNIVTKDLFINYKTPQNYAVALIGDLEKEIFSTGFYKQKAKSIIGCCKMLIDDYGSEVPANFDELIKLPGVGRKTASVVVGNAFNIPAIAVDTHVTRISNLLGLVKSKNPTKIEDELKKILPKKKWINSTHWFINHGRAICIARRPKCDVCLLNMYCPKSK